jgi:pilus assembly protein CpaF
MEINQTDNSVWNFLNDLSNKKGITEVVINGPKSVFVERGGKFIQLNVSLSKNDIYAFTYDVASYNNKECDADQPILDGILPDGSRINIIIEPFVDKSPAISIRKYLKDFKTFDTATGAFGIFDRWSVFFKACVMARVNLIVSGGTGVGKTTFLNMLLNEVHHDERIITIEDTLELQINTPNSVRLEASLKSTITGNQVTVRDLVKNTLRMRPDRIIVGETRGGEIFDLFQAMNTGHNGSMSSVHANSPGECLSRMETLYLLAGYDVPYHVVRRQIASALNIIVQISRDDSGKRIVSNISELTGVEGDRILSHDLATYNDGGLKASGIAPSILSRLIKDGDLPQDFFDV